MDHFRIVTDPSHLAAGRRALLMLGLSTFLNRSPEDDRTAQPGERPNGRRCPSWPGGAWGTRAARSLLRRCRRGQSPFWDVCRKKTQRCPGGDEDRQTVSSARLADVPINTAFSTRALGCPTPSLLAAWLFPIKAPCPLCSPPPASIATSGETLESPSETWGCRASPTRPVKPLLVHPAEAIR